MLDMKVLLTKVLTAFAPSAWVQLYGTAFSANNTASKVTGLTITHSDNYSEFFTIETNQITIKKSGIYKVSISWQLSASANNTNVKRIALYKNGSQLNATLGRDNSYNDRSSFYLDTFAAGDVLTVYKRAEDNNSTFTYARVLIETMRTD